MIGPGHGFFGRRRQRRDLGRQMVAQTNAFLNWALARDGEFPRIPTRRVDAGGFAFLKHQPAAQLAAAQWWTTTLEQLRDE